MCADLGLCRVWEETEPQDQQVEETFLWVCLVFLGFVVKGMVGVTWFLEVGEFDGSFFYVNLEGHLCSLSISMT